MNFAVLPVLDLNVAHKIDLLCTNASIFYVNIDCNELIMFRSE